jgi:hypothetical protein
MRTISGSPEGRKVKIFTHDDAIYISLEIVRARADYRTNKLISEVIGKN